MFWAVRSAAVSVREEPLTEEVTAHPKWGQEAGDNKFANVSQGGPSLAAVCVGIEHFTGIKATKSRVIGSGRPSFLDFEKREGSFGWP